MSAPPLPGFRLIGAFLVMATVAAGVMELGPPALPQPAAGAVSPVMEARSGPAAAPAGAGGLVDEIATAGAGQPTGPASASPGDAPQGVVPVDPATAFMSALKAARDMPQPPAPPGVAEAKTFPEAFEAMQRAQREPPSSLAGVSPFSAPAR